MVGATGAQRLTRPEHPVRVDSSISGRRRHRRDVHRSAGDGRAVAGRRSCSNGRRRWIRSKRSSKASASSTRVTASAVRRSATSPTARPSGSIRCCSAPARASAMLTTRGFRDVLELRRLRLPSAQDYFTPRPRSLVPRRLVREIDERMLANGEVYRPIERDDVLHAVDELLARGRRGAGGVLSARLPQPGARAGGQSAGSRSAGRPVRLHVGRSLGRSSANTSVS